MALAAALLATAGIVVGLSNLLAPKRAPSSSGPLRTWTGSAGAVEIAITRSGSSWAWYVEGGALGTASGSAATAKLAMTSAFRTAIEQGGIGAEVPLTLRSDDGTILGSVMPDGDGWRFDLQPPSGEEVTVTGIATRGAAALQLLDTIEPFTDGSA